MPLHDQTIAPPVNSVGKQFSQRAVRTLAAMAAAGVDYLITTSPENIRMLAGYWPVTGASALIFGSSKSVLVIPKDEENLAKSANVDEIRPYVASTLTLLESPAERILAELQSLAETLKPGVVAIDGEEKVVPSTYVARWQIRMTPRSIEDRFPGSVVVNGSKLYAEQRSILTDSDLKQIRSAVESARCGFENLFKVLTDQMTEAELASRLSIVLSANSTDNVRAGGQFFCMSGPNSARASASFQQSGNRRIRSGEVLLIHCNSYLDGVWTDITRTYWIGPASTRFRELSDALLFARDAALSRIRPGVCARNVDAAARESLMKRGLATYFTHGLGHGVGFSAINHLARPVLHPQSDDILVEGMVFNIEPAVYFPHEFGIRRCDMALVTSDGVELLTIFM